MNAAMQLFLVFNTRWQLNQHLWKSLTSCFYVFPNRVMGTLEITEILLIHSRKPIDTNQCYRYLNIFELSSLVGNQLSKVKTP